MTQLMCYKEILDSMLLASNDRRVSIAEGASSQKPADPGASSGSQADPISVEEDNMDSIVTASEKENGEERRPLNLNINTEQPFDRFSWHLLFRHLHLDPNVSLSDDFLFESRTVIYGNGLENRLYDGKCLWDYVDCWVDYVRRLGLGDPGNNRDPNGGKSEDRLELVYRNVRTTAQRKGKKRRSGQKDDPQQDSLSKDWTQTQAEVIGASAESLQLQEEARLLALAIEESLKQTKLDEVGVPDSAELTSLQDALYPSKSQTVGVIAKSERDELELDQGEAVVAPPTAEIVEADSVPATQNTQPVSASTSTTKPASARSEGSTKRKRPKDGSIIGSHVFHHDRSQLSKSLEGVLHFWMGIRQPEGVNIEHVSRCGWCEFEEGCEWRYVRFSIQRSTSNLT
jgi:exonuclease V